MNEFREIRERVDIKSIAEMYGLEIKHNGMCCCPFHDEKTPSMKLYERDNKYYCFGCGKSGDGIDLCAGLTGLSPKDAAKEIDKAFGLGLYNDSKQISKAAFSSEMVTRQNEKAAKAAEEEWLRSAYIVVSEYYKVLNKWESTHRPKAPDEPPDTYFTEALIQKSKTEMILDDLKEDGHDIYQHNRSEVEHIAKRLREIRQLGLDKILPVKQEKVLKGDRVSLGHKRKTIKL